MSTEFIVERLAERLSKQFGTGTLLERGRVIAFGDSLICSDYSKLLMLP